MQYFEAISKKDEERVFSHHVNSVSAFLRDVDSIREWCKKQPHFPEIPCDRKIKNFLVMNKCRIEITKQKMDMYYTIRSRVPDFFDTINASIKPYMDNNFWVPLPKLTEDLSRILIFKLTDDDPSKFDPFKFFALSMCVSEIRMIEERCLNNVVLIDLEGCGIGHFSKISLVFLKKASTIFEKMFTSSIKGLHFINCPPTFDAFMKIFKTAVPAKTTRKVFCHATLDTLHECMPKRVLPKNYGGEERSIEELNEKIKLKVEEYRDYFERLQNLKVDESLRPGPPLEDDFFGFQGSFKKLDVD